MILILAAIVSYLIVAQVMLPSEGADNSDYYNSERGQLFGKLRSPFFTLQILGGVTLILTFILTLPIWRYVTWKHFKVESGQ